MKNALDQICPKSRTVIHYLEKLTEDAMNDANHQATFGSSRDVVIILIANTRNYQDMPETLRSLSTDLWAILSAKAEVEAEELGSFTQGDGL